MTSPLLTIYTPTFNRPKGLARCLDSVRRQTLVHHIEHLVIPDHVGVGIDGMYARVPLYASAVHGQYVTFLCDDDELASDVVVESFGMFVHERGHPEFVLVATKKGDAIYPLSPPWPPQLGGIDLNCAIVRADVWKRHAGSYGHRYEGDFDFLVALQAAGVCPVWCPLLFSIGGVSRGVAEAA